MTRRFRIEEAEAMLPEVERSIRQAIQHKRIYEEADGELDAINRRVVMSGGVRLDRGAVLEKRAARDQSAAGLKDTIETLNGLGVQVKDLDQGLVDFPTMYQGREVLLCWKLGESKITYWHETDAGFAGRREVDREFREGHAGDATN